jgi:hypothetical protein
MPVPEVQTWRLVEALSLLAILLKADEIKSFEVTNLFGQTGPFHFIKDGRSWYLWSQPMLAGYSVGFKSDLLIPFLDKQELLLAPCIYEPREQLSIIGNVLSVIEEKSKICGN